MGDITTRLTAMEYLCHKRSQIHCVWLNHNHFLSSRMTLHIFIKQSKTTGINSGARTAYYFGAPVFTYAPVHFLAR